MIGMYASSPSQSFREFASALERVANRLDDDEWFSRGKREALSLLNALEPRLSGQLAELTRLVLMHHSGDPQDALLEQGKRDYLEPLDSKSRKNVPNWQHTLDFHVVVLLSYLIDFDKPVPRGETGEAAVALARLVPEEDLVAAYEAVYPEVYAELERWRLNKPIKK